MKIFESRSSLVNFEFDSIAFPPERHYYLKKSIQVLDERAQLSEISLPYRNL